MHVRGHLEGQPMLIRSDRNDWDRLPKCGVQTMFWDHILFICTFTWSREAIGTRIIYRFKELGTLLFMKKIITDDRNN